MIYEERCYDVAPAFRDQHIKYLAERASPTVVKYGGKFLSMWETIIGERNQVFVWFGWDNLNQRSDSWAKIVKDPEFWPAQACSTKSKLCTG